MKLWDGFINRQILYLTNCTALVKTRSDLRELRDKQRSAIQFNVEARDAPWTFSP